MPLASFAIRLSSRKSARRFEIASNQPGAVQRAKVLSLMRKNAETVYGRRYGFASIRTVEDFQKQVPVVTYNDIRRDIDRTLEGESGILTAEDPVMFAQTSGTTGDPKFIPVTPTCKGQEHSDIMRTWLFHASEAHPDIFAGKIVSLVSPAIEGHAPSGVPFGSTSGHMYRNIPWVVRRAYSIPYDVFEISDYLSKYYVIMRISLEHDVRFLCTANPSSILKMCEKADEFSEQIIKDVRDGTVSGQFEIDDRIRAVLARVTRPNPDAARALYAARKRREGRLLPGDYWPRLCLIGCWKGGTVGHYISKFDEWFDPDGNRRIPVRDWGYLSSESRGSIPLSDDGSQGALTIASNFFEFVDVDELESRPRDWSSWRFLTADRLETDREYYIFVTTSGGLYRYDINDVIKVAGRYGETPQITFLRKGRGMTNITGEKLSVNQVIDAYDEASRSTGALPAHFKAEADIQESRYVFRVEFANRVEESTCHAFLRKLDESLKKINIEYEAKRNSLRLGMPVLHVMKDGWYERGRTQQAASGKRVFQAKTEVLSPFKLSTNKLSNELDRVIEIEEGN